MYFISRHQNYD